MAKLDVDEVDLPPLPVQHVDFQDGYEWRDAMREAGWNVPGLWGQGWNLGRWPLTVLALLDRPRSEVWAYATYTEGDVEVHAFDSEHERDHAATEEAVFWWRNGDADGPDDLPDAGWLPHHFGPFAGF